MTNQEILVQLTTIFRTVMNNDTITLTENTTATDIEEWDSITHIQLIVALEKQFKIRFHASEIRSFKNVGELCTAVKNKTA